MGIKTTNPLLGDLNHIIEHTQELWSELRGERLFITGGTGFFGCWLLESFCFACDRLKLNANAVVLTRNPEMFLKKAPHLANHSAITLYKGNILDYEFPEGTFAFVIHAATEASTALNNENPLLMFDTIVEGTRRTLEFASTHGTGKLLLTSSGAVYGQQPSGITHIHETFTGAPNPIEPGSVYGEGKRAAEMLCCLFAQQSNLEVKIARCFTFVGPYLPIDTHFAVCNFIHDASQGKPILIKGDGTSYRSYLYAADLAIWLWKILFKGATGGAYNVGSERAISISALARKIGSLFNNSQNVITIRNATSEISHSRYVPNTKRAQAELGLQEWIGLDEALKRTILYYHLANLND